MKKISKKAAKPTINCDRVFLAY